MLRWLRSLLMICLAVALPIQGMTSVTMVHCGPGHQAAEAPSALRSPAGRAARSLSAEGDHHSPARDESAETVERFAEGGPASLTTAQAGMAEKQDGYDPPERDICGACSFCCMGTSMTSPQHALPFAPVATNAPPVARTQLLLRLAPGGLERPPRPNFV